MVREAGSRNEGILAEWAFDRSALVNAAPHVLSQVVGALEVTITIGTVEVLVVAFLLLMFIAIIFKPERSVASLAVVRIGKVTLCLHVLLCSSLGTKACVASLTIVGPSPVTQGIHVLSTSTPGVEAASAGITLVAAHIVRAYRSKSSLCISVETEGETSYEYWE